MYMRNNRSIYDKYNKYNIGDIPANYSGQYRKDPVKKDNETIIEVNFRDSESNKDNKKPEKAESKSPESSKEDKKEEREKKGNPHSLISGLFKGDKAGNKGLLSRIFGEKDDKGILGGLELEDLILIAIIFFLLKDGVDDDFLIILALILLT